MLLEPFLDALFDLLDHRVHELRIFRQYLLAQAPQFLGRKGETAVEKDDLLLLYVTVHYHVALELGLLSGRQLCFLLSHNVRVPRVISVENVRVKVEIPASEREIVKKNAKCRITSESASCDGKVKSISLSADPKSRSFATWISLNRRPSDPLFSPGLLVEVEIEVVNINEAVLIPPSALVRTGEDWFVFVSDDQVARKNKVIVGGTKPDAVWIKEGIESGTTVVVRGSNLLSDGVPIRIIK